MNYEPLQLQTLELLRPFCHLKHDKSIAKQLLKWKRVLHIQWLQEFTGEGCWQRLGMFGRQPREFAQHYHFEQ
jgi:hypothetical protein